MSKSTMAKEDTSSKAAQQLRTAAPHATATKRTTPLHYQEDTWMNCYQVRAMRAPLAGAKGLVCVLCVCMCVWCVCV